MDFKKELENILLGMGLESPVLEIDETPEGRFGGFVISESFTGKSQIERQDMLWETLDSALDEEKNLKIIGLLTMTPDGEIRLTRRNKELMAFLAERSDSKIRNHVPGQKVR